MTHIAKERLGVAATVMVGLGLSVAAVWFWVLSPLSSYEYFGKATEAEIIRHFWPIRLLQPEWFSDSLHWSVAEAAARLLVIPLTWFVLTMILFLRRYSELRHR